MAGRCLMAFLAVTLSGCGIGAVLPDNNLHAIVAGEAYRSAQPSPDELVAYSKTYGIATVLNLRGAQTRRAWYRDEIRTAERLGIRHVDFAMSPVKELSQAEASRLVAIMAEARKPILIHCLAGSDRSGLAAALYLAAIAGSGDAAAESQLSLRYGHLPFVGTSAMRRTFEKMSPQLAYVAADRPR